ncbi:MAG: hypothetical protein ACO3JL_01850 [Myxococcota bacterium]
MLKPTRTATVHALAVAVLMGLAPAVHAEGTVRLLVLDAETDTGLSDAEVGTARALVTDALRGRPRLLVATSDDVRRRAPLQADRARSCVAELCLHELADELDADFVLFARIDDAAAARRSLRLSVFSEKSGEVIVSETVEGDGLEGLAPFVSGAMDRMLEPVLAEAVPTFYERPLFLLGTGVLGAGLLVAAGAGGYALELENSLAEPERHRDIKQRALDNGPALLLSAGIGAATAVVGAGLLLTSLLFGGGAE